MTIFLKEYVSHALYGSSSWNEDLPMGGKEFRENVLIPAIKSLPKGDKLIIDLDGLVIITLQFLRKAFLSLSKEFDKEIEIEFVHKNKETVDLCLRLIYTSFN